MEMPSDEALMELIQEGQKRPYGILLERYWARLVSYAFPIVERRDDAEDIVQEVFIRLWQHRARWKPTGTLSAYLYRVTRNLALNVRRQRAVQTRGEAKWRLDPTSADPESDPHEDLLARSLQQKISAAVDCLPERRREIFILSRYHHLSYHDIAETMGISLQTVKNQMSAALKQLREAVSDDVRS
jgi:RNA polymerase sigma-70 factor, ECF subfamily